MPDREKVIKEFEEICGYTMRPHEFFVLNNVLALLKEQEAVVHCKDCRYSNQLAYSDYFICSKPFASNREAHTADWFCADGKLKN